MSTRLPGLILVPLLAVAALAAPPLVQELRVQADSGNVLANHLAGAWVPVPELNERLGTKATAERLEFTPDESVLEGLPAGLTEPLKDLRVWQAGVAVWQERGATKRYPYLLVTHTGNPTVLVFRSRGGKELDDGESALLTVVPGKERARDLLFVGGDFDNEPFRAYRREDESR